MKALWKIAVPLASLIVIGAFIYSQVYLPRVKARKLAEDAQAFRVRAEQGDAKAQVELGQMYYHGEGAPRDYPAAANWFRKAADQGDARGQYSIGNMYFRGQALPQDYAQSARWYRKAADQGDAKAEHALGLSCFYGEGVPRGYAEAYSWYRRAAEQGLARAQYDLGLMYFSGYGVTKDRAEAYRWFQKAADQRYVDAQRALGLRPRQFTIPGKISLAGIFLGSLFFPIALSFSQKESRRKQRGAALLAGLFGVVYVGMALVWYLSTAILPSAALLLIAITKEMLGGASVAILLSLGLPKQLVLPKRAAIMIGFPIVLLVMLNVVAIARFGSSPLVSRIARLAEVNALPVGMTLCAAIVFWLDAKRKAESTSADGGETAPLPES